MKKLFAKWLSALLVACMLLSPAAFMEEAMSEDISEEAVSVEGTDDSDANIPEEEANEESEKAGEEEIIESAEVDEILPEALDESFEAEEFDLSTYEEEDDFISEEDVAEITTQYEAASTGSIGIDETNFPDAKFRTYITESFDSNKDGSLSAEEITAATRISIVTNHPSDLTGIKLFTNLKSLSLGFNDGCVISKPLDLSDCVSLENIFAQTGSLGELNLSGCTNLKELVFLGFCLERLNVSGCTALTTLRCDGNHLTTLDLSSCSNLETLSCNDNRLATLNVIGCAKLKNITCCANQLAGLDVRSCTGLVSLECYENQLTALDVSNCRELEFLYCEGNNLTTLDVSNCSKIVPYIDNGHRKKLKHEWSDDDFYVYSPGNKSYSYFSYEYLRDMADDSYNYISVLSCDLDVNVISGTQANAQTGAQVSNQTAAYAIPAWQRKNKATISVAPGAICQLDLGGRNGKKFKSSNKKIAKVNANGQITIKKAGKVKITWKVGKKGYSLRLTIKDYTIPKSVTLSETGTIYVIKGDTYTLTCTLPAGTNSPIKWKSSNKRVASVSNGVVTFKKAGKVTITATATRGKKKAKVTFRVSK